MTKEAADFYSKGAEEFESSYNIDNIDDNYLRLLEKFCSDTGSGKILDAGCGTGRDTAFLSKKGFKAVGIDLSEEMLEIAKEKPGEYKKMDIRDLEFQDNSFDGIVCNQSLIFLQKEEMKKAFEELKRVLKPEGVIFLGLKEGEEPYKREKYDSEITQYPIGEEEAEKMLKDFDITLLEINERENLPNFLNIIARKQ